MTATLDILGPQGRIAARLAHYEHRPEQLEMAEAVATALADQRHLVVEAGTGIGKSFAYLVPAILHAAGDAKAKAGRRRVVISTHTISLQEQLIQKDIPFLAAVMPVEFSAVLVKGRGNYVSLRRLAHALGQGHDRWIAERHGLSPARLGLGRGPQRARQLPGQAMFASQRVLLLPRAPADAQRPASDREPCAVL